MAYCNIRDQLPEVADQMPYLLISERRWQAGLNRSMQEVTEGYESRVRQRTVR